MSNQIHFTIQRGSIVSDCMAETYEFISQNSDYFHGALKPIRNELSEGGTFTFISYEKNWSFGTVVEKSELGKISMGKGAIVEGSNCSFDEILESLEA